MEINYIIGESKYSINLDDSVDLFTGEDYCISERFGDIAQNSNWYKKGFQIINFNDLVSFESLKKAVNDVILQILEKDFPSKSLNDFQLEKYHEYVSEDEHIMIDKSLKRLYPSDFNFDDELLIDFITKQINVKVDYKNNILNNNHWIILRVNLPHSQGFNPPHKDIYQYVDNHNQVPKMINTWIPICGVNDKTGLPIVPGSHLLKESQIIRTKAGTKVNGKRFFVNCIKNWAGKNQMYLASPNEGELLIFSSNLIHGLGINNNLNQTRISLEFRLHKVLES